MFACTDVAVIIPARNEESRIAATVTAASAVSNLVVVVDDASRDKTAHLAREAGAVVVSRSRSNGKAAAMMAGARVVAAYEVRNSPSSSARHLLFLDADLEATASEAWKLVPAVHEGTADMTIAVLPAQKAAGGGHGLVVGLATTGIAHLTGFTPVQPLSGMRCMSREAFEAVQPLARGWGAETALTVDILRRGYKIAEVPAEFHHRVTSRGFRAQVHRAKQFRDVAIALTIRYLRGRLRLTG